MEIQHRFTQMRFKVILTFYEMTTEFYDLYELYMHKWTWNNQEQQHTYTGILIWQQIQTILTDYENEIFKTNERFKPQDWFQTV